MYQEYARQLNRNWSQEKDGIDFLAKLLADMLCVQKKLQHLERLWVSFTLPDQDTEGMVRLCAVKNQEPTDKPAIALNIACGGISLGGVTIQSWDDLADILSGATLDPTDITGFNPDAMQAMVYNNGQWQMVTIDQTSCNSSGTTTTLSAAVGSDDSVTTSGSSSGGVGDGGGVISEGSGAPGLP